MHLRQQWQPQERYMDMCIVVYDANNNILGIGRDENWLSELLANCSDATRVMRFMIPSGNQSPMSDTE